VQFIRRWRPRHQPVLAAVVGALDDLPEPAAGLRYENPVGIHRRALHVKDLPARKKGPADVPLLPFAVRAEDEGALLGADEYAHAAHVVSLQNVRNALDRAYC